MIFKANIKFMNSETNRIEYKQELTDDLEKEAVAFLNYPEGGVLYIGIEKRVQQSELLILIAICSKSKIV